MPGSITVTFTLAGSHLLAQRLRERVHAELRQVVDRRAEVREAAGDGRHVDDVAAALLAHDRQRRVRAVQEAEQVHLDHPAPLARVGADHGPEQHHAGVVDEHVEPAQLLLGARDERVRLCLVGDVGLDRERAPAVAVRSAWRAASMRSERRAASDTAAPARASVSAVASPMPDEAPVIAATRPERSGLVHSILLARGGSVSRRPVSMSRGA